VYVWLLEEISMVALEDPVKTGIFNYAPSSNYGYMLIIIISSSSEDT
jgi:hypothetical protein